MQATMPARLKNVTYCNARMALRSGSLLVCNTTQNCLKNALVWQHKLPVQIKNPSGVREPAHAVKDCEEFSKIFFEREDHVSGSIYFASCCGFYAARMNCRSVRSYLLLLLRMVQPTTIPEQRSTLSSALERQIISCGPSRQEPISYIELPLRRPSVNR